MKILSEEACHYVLYVDQDQIYWMEVECGTAAVFTVKIRLTEQEKVDYSEKGDRFLHELAWRVKDSPEVFQGRKN